MTLKIGALYQIDDEFRRTVTPATATGMSTGMVGMETATWGQGKKYGTKYPTNWRKYQNGLAFLMSIDNHSNSDKSYDICKVMFNNENGVRFLYRKELELAKKVSK